VNDSHGMARVHDLNDRPQQRSRSALRVMPLGNNPIEKLSSGAQLHDQMDRVLVFIRALELHNVGLPGQVVHDLDLPPYVLNVLLVHKLSLGYGLASKLLARHLVGAKMGDPELAPAKLFSDRVNRPDVFHRPAQYGADRRRLGGPGRSAGCGSRRSMRLCMAGGVPGSAAVACIVGVF
jgi:hypothetical protein